MNQYKCYAHFDILTLKGIFEPITQEEHAVHTELCKEFCHERMDEVNMQGVSGQHTAVYNIHVQNCLSFN